MKFNIFNKTLVAGVLIGAMGLTSCSLDEVNPVADAPENRATTVAGFETLVNQCYFGMQRRYFGHSWFMYYGEASTDLWTRQGNQPTEWQQFFWFQGKGSVLNTTFTNDLWNASYDGIAAATLCLKTIDICPFDTQEARNVKEAQVRFMRALYYYYLVETFGAVPVLDVDNYTVSNNSPSRTAPIEIYKNFIIPDLQYAAQHLEKGDDSYNTVPTKKSALGLLAKAALATQQYGTTEFYAAGKDAAQKLIADAEGGGATYGAYLYPNLADVFAQENNHSNKEALYKYYMNVTDGNGTSVNKWQINTNNEHFYCNIYTFPAFGDSQEGRISGEYQANGDMMPTQHLLSLYVQNDNSLDPRYHQWFQTEFVANQAMVWKPAVIEQFGKDAKLAGKRIQKGQLGLKFIRPGDANYEADAAGAASNLALVVKYSDVYDDAKKMIINERGEGENIYRRYYPSLNKYNSTNLVVQNADKMRNANQNSIFVMRMAEIYLIAAEFAVLEGNGGQAMTYINKIRTRAGAKPLTGNADMRTVLDERGRELCGEFTRFYDLKRTGMLNTVNYLQETHPFLAQYWAKDYVLRPIPQNYLNVISNGQEGFQNPGY